MNCPNCTAPIGEHVTEYGDHACPNCGLAGPRDVLEGLAVRRKKLDYLDAEVARLRSPAVVLAEAERLLRDQLVNRVRADTAGVTVVTFTGTRGWGYSLAEAYAKLKEASDG